jgi:hypothetical protein
MKLNCILAVVEDDAFHFSILQGAVGRVEAK